MTAISVSHLTFEYDDQLPTIEDATVNIPSSKFSLLVGPSGCGKSTLLKIIANLYPDFGGTISSGSVKIEPDQRVAMMFQDPSHQFTLDTPRHEIIFALENLQLDHDTIDQRIQDALNFCNIESLADRQFGTLSGGEKQKCALAVMIAMNSDIFLLDEPFASVDPQSRNQLIERLAVLKDQYHKTIVVTDHDLTGYEEVVDEMYRFDVIRHRIEHLSEDEKHKVLADHFSIHHVPVTLPSDQEHSVIELRNLQLTRGTTTLADIDSFNFYDQQITLITGQNGIGKSTLFSAIAKLFSYKGVITLNHTNIQKIRSAKYHQQIAMVFQEAASQFVDVTVNEELELSKKHRLSNYFSDQMINDALNSLGLSGFGERVVYSLSQGQQKKLQILLMLIISPSILLLDEPLTGLDEKSITGIFDILKKSCEAQHQTVIMISHQLTKLSQWVDHHVLFSNQTLTYQEVI